MAETTTPLKPSANLLVKIGSYLVHAREALQPGPHAFARMQLELLGRDPELLSWLRQMDDRSLLPATRVILVNPTDPKKETPAP